MPITVYTKPNCPQCEATKRQLTRQGLAFEVIDLTQDPSALDTLREAGFMQAPVVMTGDDFWSGYRPDKIRALAKAIKAAAADGIAPAALTGAVVSSHAISVAA